MLNRRAARARLLVALALCVLLAGAASAATNYLEKYAEKVSEKAYEAAMEAEPVARLSGEDLSLYRLGFAAGYDAARAPEETRAAIPKTETYVLNKNTKKFHLPSCRSVKQIKDKNKQTFTGTRQQVINKGYSPCAICQP